MTTPDTAQEQNRLEALKIYDILDTPPEQEMDDIARLASEICQTPIALISFVDDKRQWFKSRIGLDVPETDRKYSFCSYAIEGDSVFEVCNPLDDARFRDNPLVTGHPNIRYYAGAPLITPTGLRLGTLCVIDSSAHTLSDNQKNSIQILARSVISILELRRQKKDADFFRKALDEVAAVTVTDAAFNYEYVNERFCELMEMRPEELIGKSGNQIRLADITDTERNTILDAIQNREVFRGRVKNLNKKGDVSWSRVAVIPYTNRNNELIKIFGIRIDITAKIQMLDRFEQAEKLSSIGSWEYNLLNGERYWSKGLYRILGFSEDEIPASTPSLVDYIIPEDQASVMRSQAAVIDGSMSAGTEEIRVRRKDGVIRILASSRRVERNTKGELVILAGTLQDITERKEAERQLKESLAHAQDLFDNAPCGYHVFDANATIIDMNKTELEWLGYTREDIIGKPGQIIVTQEKIADFISDFETLKRTGVMKDRPRRLKCKNGNTIDTLATGKPEYDEHGNFISARVTVYDVRDLKKIQDRLEESESKYRALVEETSQMSYTTDVEGRYNYANARLKKVIGYDDDEIIGKQFAFIYDEDWRKKTIQFYIKQLSDGVPETIYTFPIKTKDGKKIWLEQVATLIREGDDIKGFRCILHDITERVNTEETMREAARMATEAREMQQNFLSRMSHEIRTPMNGVLGMVNLLKNTPLDDRQRTYVEAIRESGGNMLRIINDILDISKIEAGKVIFEETPFDLDKLVNNVIFTIKPAADDKKLLIAAHIDRDIPAKIIADPVRLNQVLLNLAGNAVKFTEKGNIIISASLLNRSKDDLTLEFRISDTGIGIAKEKLGSVFESFTQAENNTTRKYGGTGLGLTIARQLIEQQKGTITVESEQGRGTTFIFTYHCKVDNSAASGSAADNKQASDIKGINVLLVEDNTINQMVARFTLELAGASVTIADRGAPAIDLLRSQKFDVVLMDLQMPEMSGIEATRIIRSELRDDTPIIAMTASAMKGEMENCIAAGMNDYFSKPFEPEDLYAIILKNIKRKAIEPAGTLINMPNLMRIVANDLNTARTIMSSFVADTPAMQKRLLQHTQEGNLTGLLSDIHTLKNGIGILGKAELKELLFDIEMDVNNKTFTEDTRANLDLLRQKLILLSAEVEQELAK